MARHQPQAIVLQCGADAVHEAPLSRLALSNAAHWSAVSALLNMAPRLLVLGGGGYNPWATGRLWSGVWAVLNGFPIPEVLPASARAVLEALTWPRRSVPEQALLMGLRDPPRGGKVRDVIFDRIRALTQRWKKEF